MAYFVVACRSSKIPDNVTGEGDIKRYDCLQVIKNVSYYWQIDSLANNGYRRQVWHRLHNCIVDSMYADTVKRYLGTPSKITTYSYPSQFSYSYYYYDSKYLDTVKASGFPRGFDGIILFFDKTSQKLIRISHTTGEY